jgi:hypothetical protein
LCAVALLRLPAPPAEARPARRLRGELLLTAALAGTVSAVIALYSPLLGPFWSGLLASLPVISSAVLAQQHLTVPHADRRRFLRGYATGLVGKAAFATAFAAAAAQVGASLAMALAAVVGIAVSIGLSRQLGSAEAKAALAPQEN